MQHEWLLISAPIQLKEHFSGESDRGRRVARRRDSALGGTWGGLWHMSVKMAFMARVEALGLYSSAPRICD